MPQNLPHLYIPEGINLHVFSITNPIFGVNVRVAKEIYVFKVKSCLGVALILRNLSNDCFLLYYLH